jgi:hypothetical protein
VRNHGKEIPTIVLKNLWEKLRETLKKQGYEVDGMTMSIQAVSIQAVDSSGKAVHFEMVYTDNNGAFTDKFKTPEGVSGEGNIFVSAGKPGYDNGTAQSAFTTVSEFSTAVIAAIISISIAMLILRKRTSK